MAPPKAPRNGSAVAFATARGNAGHSSHGAETIYVLEAGDRAAHAVHTERVTEWQTCGEGAALSWHGGWILWSANEGNVALVDPRSGRAIELTKLVRRLLGVHGTDSGLDVNVAWS